jgi:CheY-like chemotaxis protein
VRVLVVDDHRSTRESLAVGFSRLGHSVDVASSAPEAIARVQEHTYAWLICDVRMPGGSGFDVARAARDHQPHLGLILMTAYDVSEEERRVLDSLGGTLVIKPATATALVQLCEQGTTPCAPEETRS